MAVKIIQKSESKTQLAKTLGSVSTVTLVKQKKASKAEAEVLESNALNLDDLFQGDYFHCKDNPKSVILEPPFNPSLLSSLRNENNAIGQCIAAMEVNIDGTGYEIATAKSVEESDEIKTKGQGIKDFFDEVFPNKSFITVRRELRVDQESTGNAYMEVLRTVSNDIVFCKALESVTMRMVKLDDAIPAQVTVNRFGSNVELCMMVRQRRFAQKVGDKIIYFKEFGVKRHINKWTGLWESESEIVPVDSRGTEIIHFFPNKDIKTPYGLPRWINQLPSILGSRKAEELNLEFFNAGGLPPAIIAIQGGELTEPVRKQLNTYLSGKGASKHRAAVIEINSTSGDLNSAGNVKMSVERFGDQSKKDSMFENYDARCEKRVRASFRLPPLFVGKSEDINFASAFASYTVAEAQVFQPERSEFDEIMNTTIMKELDPEFVFRSLPLTVQDTTQQLKGIEMARDKLDVQGLFKVVNEVTNMNLKVPEGTGEKIVGAPTLPIEDNKIPTIQPAVQPTSTPTPTTQVSKIDPMELIDLARKWAGISDGSLSGNNIEEVYSIIKQMGDSERKLFDSYVSIELMSGFDHDPEGAIELTGAATEIMNNTGCCDIDHSE